MQAILNVHAGRKVPHSWFHFQDENVNRKVSLQCDWQSSPAYKVISSLLITLKR